MSVLKILQGYSIISMTFLMALLLMLLPLPGGGIWYRPEWVALLTFFWILFYPAWVGVGIGWSMGLGLDILTHSLLGEHALALLISAYIVYRIQTPLVTWELWQQSLAMMMIIMFYKIIIFIIQLSINQPILTNWYWLPVPITLIIWPLLSGFLQPVMVKWKMNHSS